MRDDRDVAGLLAAVGRQVERRPLLWAIAVSLAGWAVIICLAIEAVEAVVRQMPPLPLWLGGLP